jgi:hypothetical protein
VQHQQRLSPPSWRARVTRVAVAMLQMQAPHARVGAAGAACRRSTRARGARVARCAPIAAAASDAAAAPRVDETMLLGKTQRASRTSCGAVARSHRRAPACCARNALTTATPPAHMLLDACSALTVAPTTERGAQCASARSASARGAGATAAGVHALRCDVLSHVKRSPEAPPHTSHHAYRACPAALSRCMKVLGLRKGVREGRVQGGLRRSSRGGPHFHRYRRGTHAERASERVPLPLWLHGLRRLTTKQRSHTTSRRCTALG